MTFTIKLPIALCLVLVPACSASQPTSAGSGGISSAAAGTSGGRAMGGASSAGSAGTIGGGGSPIAGSAGTIGGGGTSGAASGGSSGTAGASGTAASGGTASAAGGAGLLAIASSFDKFRFECPCIDADHFGLDKIDNCNNAPAVERQSYSKKLGGEANVVYDVKLHVRGNTEPNTYVLGKLDPNGRFYVGGETSAPGYSAYMLTIAEPRQVYFFNYNPTVSHVHFLIDYEVTIPMRGGTTLTFEVNGGKSVPDGHDGSNRERLVIPGIAPAPDPYNGQLVQFDVVSVDARP
ncbi:MAG: hypothetical protein ABI488_17050 [Polyangiaceae bacterium]